MPQHPKPPAPELWARTRALFDRVVELDGPGRDAALAASGETSEVLSEVRSLLAHVDSEATDFLAATPASDHRRASAAAKPGRPPDRQGQLLGAWRLDSLLGQGGMGEVWAAHRADGAYVGRAAVKVLRRGLDSQRVLARFAQEQRALGRLNHPHIAHLLDAGRTPDDLPYFVMEAVDGQSIDRACQGRSLDERLALFLQLAEAVSHAHRQLLVHRDLKPGNVLVDRDGRVKLLDFGIAKALDPLEGERAEASLTGLGERPFTPHFASPEQVRGEPVGTGTDIYSLGVLLYVMLTGVRPYGRGATSAQEAARSVLEEQPTRPSALSPALVLDPDWLATRRRLQGDLDNILLKAMSKDTGHRYPSVDALADDVRRFLDGRPVSARQPTWTYLAGKFLRRHAAASALGAGALVAVLASAGMAVWQARQATLAQAQAEARLQQVGAIARDVVLRHADALPTMSGGLAVQERMLQGLVLNLDRLAREAGNDPDWLTDLAEAHARLAAVQGDDTGLSVGKPEAAAANAERAIALAERAWPQRPGDGRLASTLATALRYRAQVHRAAGTPESGLPLLQRGIAVLDEALSPAAAAVASGDNGRRGLRLQRAALRLTLAQLHDQQSIPSLNQPEQALALYAAAETELKALDDAQAALDTGNLLGTLHGGRALSHARLNRLVESRTDALAALAYRERAVAAEPGNVVFRDGLVNEATNAGVVLMRAGDPASALKATAVAWAQVQALARENGPGNQWMALRPRVAAHHGRALLLNGQAAAAAPVLAEALAMWQARQAAQPGPHTERMLAWMTLQRAKAEAGAGRPGVAVALVRDQLPVLQRLAEPAKARDALLNLGEALLFLSEVDVPRRAQWRARAREGYARAHALLPLTGDLLLQYRAAGGP